jgi:N-acylneuraminate cytidylyltransferase
LTPTFVRNGAIYITRCDLLREHRTLYGARPVAYEMPQELSVNIDTQQDWIEAETQLAARRLSREAA